jgi:tetratricopeptide (TPR) repeat protein
MRALLVAGAVAALALPLRAQVADARTAHFRVVSTGLGETASAAAVSLERTRQQLAALGLPVAAGPTEVLLFPEVAAVRPYAPEEASAPAGFLRQGTDHLFIAVVWKELDDPRRVLAHEVAHQATLSLLAERPLWLREGLADLLSNLQPEAGGLRAGLPIAAHVDALRRQPWIAWAQVLAATRDAEFLHDPDRSSVFYAQSWLAAHRMLVGRMAPGIRAALGNLPAPGELPNKLPETLGTEMLPVEPAESEPVVTVRALEAWEYEHRLAELLRALNRSEPAREALLELRRRHPERPEAAESLGALEMDALHYDAAEKWFEEAVRLGSDNPRTHYRYSLLLLRPGHSAEAAARYARRAVDLEAGQPLHWLALAQAEMLLARWEAARASLAQMRRHTADPVLLAQADAEQGEIGRRREEYLRPPALPPSEAPVTMRLPPPEPPPLPSPAPAPLPSPPPNPFAYPGTLTFVGYIRSVECSGPEKVLTVSNLRFAIRVRERRGQPAQLYYPPKGVRQIPCTLKNVEANVVYRPLAGLGPLNGDVVAVVF